MGYFSVWPFFPEIGLLLAIVSTPLFRVADSPPIPTSSRVENFDGLRGFLALCVFFHHAATYQQYWRYGTWGYPPSRFYGLLGRDGVCVFFMITGFLFYSQLLKAKGRPDWKKLYIGRIFRILPLYWFAVALVLLGVVLHTGWHLNVSSPSLLAQLARWSAGGIFGKVPINGYADTARLIVYVTWSLRFEWIFYLSLIVLALPTQSRLIGLLLPPALLCMAIVLELLAAQPTPLILVALFLIGMSTAAFREANPGFRIRGVLSGIAVIIFFILSFDIFPRLYRPLPLLMLGVAFFLIAIGEDLFGLLSSGPAKRLGNISYGIYLLQGPVFAATFAFSSIRAFELSSPIAHFCVSMLAATALIALATLAHAFIERPGIDLGRRLVSKSDATGSLAPLQALETSESSQNLVG